MRLAICKQSCRFGPLRVADVQCLSGIKLALVVFLPLSTSILMLWLFAGLSSFLFVLDTCFLFKNFPIDPSSFLFESSVGLRVVSLNLLTNQTEISSPLYFSKLFFDKLSLWLQRLLLSFSFISCWWRSFFLSARCLKLLWNG